MDSLTQAVLGAAVQGTVLGRIQGRRSLLYGAALGTLPDLDVFIKYADPVSQMTFHRGFSHSVFMLTALALLLAWGVHWLAQRRWLHKGYTYIRLFVAFWLVLLTHPLLDSLTVFGTQLFWPLQWVPESWSAVFIIDPLYTVPLLLSVSYALVKGFAGRATSVMGTALLLSTVYLGLCLAGRVVIEQRFASVLSQQGVTVSEVRAIPMAFNSLVWRVMAKAPNGQYYEGVSSLFDRAPPEMQRLSFNLELSKPLTDVPLHDRLRWFTDNWLRYDIVDEGLIVTDLRMGTPGNYSFRFKMAQRNAAGSWEAITPERHTGAGPGAMFNYLDLSLIWQRIFNQQPPLPLAAWTSRYLGEAEGR